MEYKCDGSVAVLESEEEIRKHVHQTLEEEASVNNIFMLGTEDDVKNQLITEFQYLDERDKWDPDGPKASILGPPCKVCGDVIVVDGFGTVYQDVQYMVYFEDDIFEEFKTVAKSNVRSSEEGLELHLTACMENEMLRVQLFKDQYPHFLPNVKSTDENLKVFTKNGDYSAKVREAANRHFTAKRNSEALHAYNLAIVYAPIPTKEDECYDDPHLALAFGNRSALLMRLDRFHEGLRDIDLAIHYGYPEDLKYKLECRRGQCEDMIKKIIKKESESDCGMRKYKEETLFKIQSPNPFLPVAQDFVEIQVHPLKGRSLIVTKDIPAGTVLIVEEPFVKNLHKELNSDLKRCHFCFNKIEGGIPCPGCIFAIYCDDTCMTSAARKYHSFECPCLPYLHMYMQTNIYTRMAFRLICIVGPHLLTQIFNTKDPRYFKPGAQGTGEGCLGCEPSTGVYRSDSYLPIYHLASQVEYLPDAQKFENTLNAITLVQVLDKFTPFFSEVNGETDESFKEFVVCVLVRHLECLACNAMSMGDIQIQAMGQNQNRKPSEFGGGLYPLSSLLNHSCVPNVTRVHDEVKGQLMSIVSTMDLKCGQELTTTYGRVFYHYDLEERQMHLKTHFNFDCDCVACVQNWPLLDAMVGKSKFCCYCEELGPGTDKSMKKYNILDKNGLCSTCGKLYNLSQLEKEREHQTNCYHEANELILQNLPLQALQLLIPCLRFFQTSMSWPNITFVLSQDLLKQAMDGIVQV